MADELEHVTSDLTRYRAASLHLMDALGRQEAVIEQSLRHARDPLPLDTHMRTAGSAEIRRDVSDRLSDFETARKDVRISLTSMLLAQGKSGVEVGELFGMSRQAASRLVIEARSRLADEEAPEGAAPAPPTGL
jgi:hypothetical protein